MIRVIIIVLSFCCSLSSNANNAVKPILATCNDEGVLFCPDKLQSTCTGRKIPICIKMNKVYIPACHVEGAVDETLTFSVDQVECHQGNKRL